VKLNIFGFDFRRGDVRKFGIEAESCSCSLRVQVKVLLEISFKIEPEN
jgi:hypothetical protein